ncbi:MAG: phage holin family protein [Bacteroidales bacterium]|nr:phage holin family protein [Bacteroidales bacterium]
MDSIIAVIVFIAMMIDLAAGLYKAKVRGDARRSEALKRTGYKFLIYEGGIMIASMVDLMIHMGKMYLIFGWDMAWGIPFVTIMMGIFWCVVEFLSVREKADEKIHSDISKAEKLAAQILKIVETIKKGESPDLDKVKEILEKDAKDIEPLDMKDM